MQAGDLPVAAYLAALGGGKTVEDFPTPGEIFHAGFAVDEPHVE